MTAKGATASLDDILDAFALEPEHDEATLERYLRAHPGCASALVELSFELGRTDLAGAASGKDDEAIVEAAWDRMRTFNAAAAVNPLSAMAVGDRQALARDLGLKMQVMALFREGRIAVETVPASFLKGFARRLGVSLEALVKGLSNGSPSLAPSYKSVDRPIVERQVVFERAIRDSGVSEAEAARLMSEDPWML